MRELASVVKRDFNSIKVRLERSGGGHLVASVPFQFHKGAIRTVGRSAARCGDVDFNSIKVRLERSREPTPTMNHPNFNSIKVRLERIYGSKDRF